MHLKRYLLALLASCSCVTFSWGQAELSAPVAIPAANAAAQETAGTAGTMADVSQTQSMGQPLAQVTSVPAQPPVEGAAPVPPAQQAGPNVPFQLTDVEQQFVDQILQMWELQSKEVKTFQSAFVRLEYEPVWGPADKALVQSKGQLSYSKPDKGSFKIDHIERWVQKDPAKPGQYEEQKSEVGEHWVCDGKAIYQYNHENKQLVVSPLPEEMRGQSIVDGPLPFLFGAEAAKLKQRYSIRSRESTEKTIWLEAFPRNQADAANYHHVDVMLDRKTMMPSAIQIHKPNGHSSDVYTFQEPKINSAFEALFGGVFSSPRTPFGWTRVVEEMPVAPQATQPVSTQIK
jgi:TIGR03009 family protein